MVTLARPEEFRKPCILNNEWFLSLQTTVKEPSWRKDPTLRRAERSGFAPSIQLREYTRQLSGYLLARSKPHVSYECRRGL